MKKRLIPLALSLCLLLPGLQSPAKAGLAKNVPEDFWGYEYIEAMLLLQVLESDAALDFYALDACTRLDFVMGLWRALGSVEVAMPKNPTFDDLAEHDVPFEAYQAVQWAVVYDITGGVSDTEFDPYGSLTREQAFTFLSRALSYQGAAVEQLMDVGVADFLDADAVSDWAKPHMERLLAAGFVQGGTDGRLNPAQSVSYAETAALLYRSVADLTAYNAGGEQFEALAGWWSFDTFDPYGVRVASFYYYVSETGIWHGYLRDEDSLAYHLIDYGQIDEDGVSGGYATYGEKSGARMSVSLEMDGSLRGTLHMGDASMQADHLLNDYAQGPNGLLNI